jgi:hypothetical protein
MRVWKLVPALLALAVSATAALAQGWIEYKNLEDRFAINLPGQPRIEKYDFMSEYGATLPAHKYSAERGDSRFTVTVIDYTHMRSLTDLRGSIAYAATAMRQKGKVTYDAYQEIDRIPGHQLQITEPSGRRIYGGFNLYEKKLYILEANVPAGTPPPELFRASLQVLDANGDPIRLDDNGNIARRGGDPAGGAAAPAAGARGGAQP